MQLYGASLEITSPDRRFGMDAAAPDGDGGRAKVGVERKRRLAARAPGALVALEG